jgi:predicted dehydrogenase
MARRTNRRKFLQESAAIGVGLWAGGGVMAQQSVSANEQIRIACIGVGGRGNDDTRSAERLCDIVALCDIDDSMLEKAASREKLKAAKRFNDYRKMFDEMEKSIDAVTVTIPDHSHAIPTSMALVRGKACFTQKPLTHTVWEARFLADLARAKKVPTIMDNWGTAHDGLRHGAALVKKGLLGTVKEVHVWTNRPIWAQGGERPAPEEKVPSNVNWDLFLGPAPARPYAAGYHPFAWRGWWDFGTGSLGDMACHTFNMPFMALDLKNPTSIEAAHWAQQGQLPELDRHQVRLSGDRLAACDSGVLVRQVQEASQGTVRNQECPQQRLPDRRRKGHAARHRRLQPADRADVRRKGSGRRIRQIARPLRRIRTSDQGRADARVELPRLRRCPHRDHPARKSGCLVRQGPEFRREEGDVGFGQPEGDQRPRARPHHQEDLPPGLGAAVFVIHYVRRRFAAQPVGTVLE